MPLLSHLRYKQKISKFLKSQSKNDDWYQNAIKTASRDEREQLHAEASNEHFMLKEQIDQLATDRLVGIARRLMVEVPSIKEEGCWEQCFKTTDRYVLTPKGIRIVREAVRNELDARSKRMLMWLTASIGVIGALTGMMAVIFK